MRTGARKQRVVVVGGGTGTHTVLRGLREYTDQIELTAIVSMADSGGSTGRLRDEFGQLPVGDVRNALTALAAEGDAQDTLLRQLFEYRFDRGNGLSGHNFGNLLLTALTDILGSEEAAIVAAGRILRVAGRVLPVTTDNVSLVAEYADGVTLTGEASIDEPTADRDAVRITALSLTPPARLAESAAVALKEADLIVLGPGDLYTSVLANVVVDGFVDTVAAAEAPVLYVCNLMSKRGQTRGFNAKAHVQEVARYLGRPPDVSIANAAEFSTELLTRYQADGDHPIAPDGTVAGCRMCVADVAAREPVQLPNGDTLERSLIRHDPTRLATLIVAELGIG